MPELPEIETTKRYLEKKIVGQRVKKIKILSPKQFLGDSREIIGQTIIKLKRRAKILIWQLEKNFWLLIHLKLTGQIVYSNKLKKEKVVFGHPIPLAGGATLPGKSTRVIIYLSRGVIFFNDLRKFGWLKIIKTKNLNTIRELENLGVEPLSSRFTLQKLQKILAHSRRAVKLILMDQSKIAGIGNIYASEILWQAKINPQKPANQIKRSKELWRAIRIILRRAIRAGGTSAEDEAYIKPDGSPGEYQKYLAVYQREGEPCPRCGYLIKRIKLSQRSTYFCPRCQS